jgi:lysophospholipase L1-like esterase
VLGALALAVGLPAAAHAAAPLKVVQIGDSYSAGNGAGDYYGPKDCYRSSSNWAERYLDTLRSTYNVTFVNRACSGGVIADLTDRREMDSKLANVFVPDEFVEKDDPGARHMLDERGDCTPDYRDDEAYSVTPEYASHESGGTLVSFVCSRTMEPQIDAVGQDTDVVLLTIGGNDVDFADIVMQCFVVGARDPGDCRDKVSAGQEGIGAVGVRTATALRTLKARMRPDAHIVIAAYPYLEKNPDYELRGGFLFTDVYAVGREVRKFGDMGDAAQRAAANALNAEGGAQVIFVDEVKSHFAGHEPDGRVCCRNDDRWIHEFDSTTKMEWYHYNSTGHAELASLLAQRPEIVPPSRDIVAGGAVDIAFVIDTTGSMGSSIESVKDAAVTLVNDISARTSAARFAVVDYRDFPERTGYEGDYPAMLDLDFSSNAATVDAAIGGLALGGGGDWPETMFSGLNRAFDLSWRPGVKKLAIVLADAPPLSPEPFTGLTANDIVQRSLSIDPVEVHFVNVGDVTGDPGGGGGSTATSVFASPVEEIAARTNGAIHPSSPSQAAAEIADAIDASLNRPYTWAGGPYVGKVGETMTLDGRGSYGVTSDLVKWEWDLDADGIYEIDSSEATVTHRFDDAYDGVVALRVTDAQGTTGLGTAITHITSDGDEIADASDNCASVSNPDQGDADADGAGDACDPTPGFATEDKPGVQDNSSSAPPTPTPAAGQVRPVADVRVTRPKLVRHGSRLRLKVTCLRAAGSCAGTIRVKVGGRKLVRRYNVRAHTTKAVTFKLGRATRARLARGRRVGFRVTATTREGITASSTVKLRLPRRP